MQQNNGFISTLFDLSFSSFITTKLIKVLYILSIVLAGFAALAVVGAGFSNGFVSGVFGLIAAVVVFFFYVMVARVWLELIMVAFRIHENVARIADSKSGPAASGPASTML